MRKPPARPRQFLNRRGATFLSMFIQPFSITASSASAPRFSPSAPPLFRPRRADAPPPRRAAFSASAPGRRWCRSGRGGDVAELAHGRALVGVAFVPLRDLSGRMKELGLA